MEVLFSVITIWELLVTAKVISLSLKLLKYFKDKTFEEYRLFKWAFQLFGYAAPIYTCLTIMIQVVSADWLIIESPKHPADYVTEMVVKGTICLSLTFVSWYFTNGLTKYDFERYHFDDDY